MPAANFGVLAGVSSSKKIAPEAKFGEQTEEGTALNQEQVGSEPPVENNEPVQHPAVERVEAAGALSEEREGAIGDKVVVQPQQGGSGDVTCEGKIRNKPLTEGVHAWRRIVRDWHGNRMIRGVLD